MNYVPFAMKVVAWWCKWKQMKKMKKNQEKSQQRTFHQIPKFRFVSILISFKFIFGLDVFFLFSFALCETCQSKCARTKKNDFVSHDALVKFREKFEGYFPFALEMNERLSQRQTLKIKRRTHRQTHTSRTTRLDTVDIYIWISCLHEHWTFTTCQCLILFSLLDVLFILHLFDPLSLFTATMISFAGSHTRTHAKQVAANILTFEILIRRFSHVYHWIHHLYGTLDELLLSSMRILLFKTLYVCLFADPVNFFQKNKMTKCHWATTRRSSSIINMHEFLCCGQSKSLGSQMVKINESLIHSLTNSFTFSPPLLSVSVSIHPSITRRAVFAEQKNTKQNRVAYRIHNIKKILLIGIGMSQIIIQYHITFLI